MGTISVAHAVPEAQVEHQEARWRDALAPYAEADIRRSLACLATSVVPYFALLAVMWFLLPVSYALVLLVSVPAAGFLVRTFIIFHDCTHGSFLPTKRGNTWVGVLVGLIVYSPFHSWRHEHAQHHASSGDLDRRGIGDVETWTVAEYRQKPWLSRLGYRLFRSPLVMFTVGPIWALALEPRKVPIRARPRILRSHVFTDLALLAIVGGIILLIGWSDYLLIQVPTIALGGAAGVWLFYVQHQFEDAYWEHSGDWNYVDAALAGSSYLKLPKVLQFFTGNIGLHHIHHLLARIPNYNLQRAHDENKFLHRAPTISLWQGLCAVRLKLYDEDSRRMVTFAQARAIAEGSAA
ncbi:MAG TPA: fatty acid desaturase [Solirubrobacteraceae bacterium]|nr:fatty acid desaturase [Solirubrobacteraceae bacterium]